MSETALAHRLTIWSDQLLDVTLRNPLLSLRSNAGLPVWSDPWDLLGALSYERARLAEQGRLEEDGPASAHAGNSVTRRANGSPPSGALKEPQPIGGAIATWNDGLLIVPYPITLLGTGGALAAWSGKDWSEGLPADAPLGSWLYQDSPAPGEPRAEQTEGPAGNDNDDDGNDDDGNDDDGNDDNDGDGRDEEEDENTTLLGDIQPGQGDKNSAGYTRRPNDDIAVSARRRSRQQTDERSRQRIVEHNGRLIRDARTRDKVLRRLGNWAETGLIALPVLEPSAPDRSVLGRATNREGRRGVLAVDGSPETLQGHLTRLDRVCRQKEEDHGVHTLFLACGLVRWTDPTGAARMAPLVLVPVRLVRADTRSPWAIEPHADRPRINPSLRHLLASKNQVDLTAAQDVLDSLVDQGIEPNPTGEVHPLVTGQDVAQATREALERSAGQSVALWDEGRLVVASYARHAMWSDLQERRGEVAQHPLVQRLAGDEAAVALSGPEDDEQARQAWGLGDILALPLPADGSQRAAIARAADERTEALVIQGPPGTGKSQTIANLIAHLMDQGRTILFVSEKLTALDVVHQRLIDAGLGPFCLEMHTRSEQASHLAQRLSDTLEAARRVSGSGPAVVRKDGRMDGRDSFPRPESRVSVEVQGKNRRAVVLDQSVAFLHQTTPQQRNSLFSLIGQWMEAHVRWALPGIAAAAGESGRKLSETREVDGATAWRSWLGGRDRDPAVEQAEETWIFLAKHKIDTGDGLGDRVGHAREGWQRLDRWTQRRPNICESLRRRLELGDTTILPLAERFKQARSFPTDWIEAWIGAGQREEDRSLWEALDGWTQARTQWTQRWGPWAKLFTMDVVTAPDTVWRAWEATQRGLGRWFRQRAWRRAVQQWEQPGVEWADWVRWSWERAAILGAYEAVKASGVHLERLARGRGVVAPGRGRGRVDTATLMAMAAWGTQCTIDTRKARAGQELLGELWKAEVDNEKGETIALSDAYQRIGPWLGLACDRNARRLVSSVEPAGGPRTCEEPPLSVWSTIEAVMALADTANAHREEMERRMTWRAEIQAAGGNPLLDWWAGQGERERQQIRVRPDEVWAGWQAGRSAQHALDDHVDLARALGSDRDSLITLYREFLAGDDRRAREQVVAGLLARAHALAGSPEAAVLAREVLRRRPASARALLRRLPTLAPVLLPCMMMSPLSAAEYLPPERAFDVVIFDEASQIAIGDAIGTVSRGRTVIVVGDEKQMPPTSVFAGSAAETTSILDECLAAGVPRALLTWHYRSQRERLIAFSNTTYYHGDLMTFPDARVGAPSDLEERQEYLERTGDEGLGSRIQSVEHQAGYQSDNRAHGHAVFGSGGLYVHEVNGLYDRGGSGTNHDEAVAIVEALTRHMEQQSRETIGVITFNRKQQTLIEDLWDKRMAVRPDLEAQANDLGKPITVRNLENAQGDERDVVLFSTTFGRDVRGRFPMTFGPLGQPGGERRLNVAITRAKRRLDVYTSFGPQDIDLSRVSGQGVRDLRSWLSFARGEHEALLIPTQNTDGAADSPFEKAVRVELERLGWVVHGQVGCSGYRIDLAVVDPRNPQRYLAGVECDGATYHSIKSARDRDILRTQILEARGWQICRVWSTNWFRRPDAALAELHRQLLALSEL